MPYKWKDDKKAYQKEYHAKWYKENKERAKAQKKKFRAERIAWFQEYKTKQGCRQCGASHPAVLDCHHIDPSEKEFVLSSALRRDWSKERILKELAKCDILCANCHRIHHWNEKNKPWVQSPPVPL